MHKPEGKPRERATTVVGVDPGSVCTGYGVLEFNRNKLKAIDYGTIRCRSSFPLHKRLLKIHDELVAVLETRQPQAVSVESLFYAANVRSALTLGHVRGGILLAASKLGIPIYEYSPLEVKQAVTGYGRASKAQIIAMVKVLLRLEAESLTSDSADALAIAICHAHSFKGLGDLKRSRTHA